MFAPGDAIYDEARAVFYGDIDRRPALIVRAKDVSDVSRVVLFAREGEVIGSYSVIIAALGLVALVGSLATVWLRRLEKR